MSVAKHYIQLFFELVLPLLLLEKRIVMLETKTTVESFVVMMVFNFKILFHLLSLILIINSIQNVIEFQIEKVGYIFS